MNWKGVGKTVQKPVITFVTQMLRNMRHFWGNENLFDLGPANRVSASGIS